MICLIYIEECTKAYNKLAKLIWINLFVEVIWMVADGRKKIIETIKKDTDWQLKLKIMKLVKVHHNNGAVLHIITYLF